MMIKKYFFEKIIYLSILVVLLSACDGKQYQKEDIVGTYENFDKGHKDYNFLMIREDSTYFLVQSPDYADFFLCHYGKWELKNQDIILFEGIDFTDNLIIKQGENNDTDSLSIKIDKELFNYFPNLVMSVDEYDDLILEEREINFIKSDLLMEDILHHKYVPLYFCLRNGNYYAKIECFFEDRTVEISLKDDNFFEKKHKEFVRYKINDSYIKLKTNTHELAKNKLKKMEE